MCIRHKTMNQEHTKIMKSKTLDIFGLYLLTGSAPLELFLFVFQH